ncbi:MAG: hypothetical protein IKV35_02525 [Clostridia bacterium]|nr:hypothetical protein [Clostridia bacterium]
MNRLIAILLCVALLLLTAGCQPEGTYYIGGDEPAPTEVPKDETAPYKAALDTFFDLYYLADPATLDTVVPDAVWAFSEAGKDDTVAYLRENRLYEQSRNLTLVGENMSYSYAVGEIVVLSESSRNAYAENLAQSYGIDNTAVTDIAILSIVATLKGDLAESEEDLTLTLFALDGRYYVETALDTVVPTLVRNAVYR